MEILKKRTYTTKHFDKGNDSFAVEAFNKPVHFKDDTGEFQDVDLTIQDKDTYFEVAKTEFPIKVQKNFLTADFLQFKNKYKEEEHLLNFDPASLIWFNKKDRSDEVVVSQPQNVDGVVEGNKIIYKNAYGEGLDFEITVLLTGFRKELVINNGSFLTGRPSKKHELVLLMKHTNNTLSIKTKPTQKGDVAIDILDDLNKNPYIENVSGFEFGLGKKTHIYSGNIFASNATLKSEQIKLFWLQEENLYLGKILPFSFLENETYPIRADSTINGTISQDNWIDGNQPDHNWNGSLTFFRVGNQGAADWARGIARFVMPSDPGGGVSIDKVEVQFKQSGGNALDEPFTVNLHEDDGGTESTTWTETGSTWNKYDGSNAWTAAGAASDFESTIVDSHTTSSGDTGSFISWVVYGTGATNPITITWDDTLNLLLRDPATTGAHQLDLYKDEQASADIGKIVVTYSVAAAAGKSFAQII